MEGELIHLPTEIRICQRRIHKACAQISQLKKRLVVLRQRSNMAKNDQNKQFRYRLENRIMVIKGMMAAYLKYADKKLEEADRYREQLYQMEMERAMWNSGDNDSEDDDSEDDDEDDDSEDDDSSTDVGYDDDTIDQTVYAADVANGNGGAADDDDSDGRWEHRKRDADMYLE